MGPGFFEITTNSPSHSLLTANRCPLCMRFRNSRCYFGSEAILERQNLSLREGYLSVHCHHERRLEPRLRGESKSRDLLCQGPPGTVHARQFHRSGGAPQQIFRLWEGTRKRVPSLRSRRQGWIWRQLPLRFPNERAA